MLRWDGLVEQVQCRRDFVRNVHRNSSQHGNHYENGAV